MSVPSLAIPVLLGGYEPKPGTVHFEPTHIATWSSSSEAGSSRHIALAAPDNTIWVYPYSDPQPIGIRDGQSAQSSPGVPSIRATSPTPAATPQATRPLNHRVSSFSNRSRAPSTSSTRTSSSRHRITSFSPPSTAQPVTTTLSPATATASAIDGHARGNSLSERAGLMEHLREQQARNSEDGRSHVGLGINFGRKVEAQGHVDHDKTSGATSPKSVKSTDSQRASIGGRLMGWATGGDSGDEKSKKELDEQVAEITVDREMELETERDARQEEEMKTVEDAIARASPTKPSANDQSPRSASAEVIRRIILQEPGCGKIVSMEAFEELGLLCVLRDIGSLETFRLSDLSQTNKVHLEEPERRGGAGPSKHPLRLTPFWQWRSMHLAQLGSALILALDGLPWSCGQPSHNGDVTRVVLVSFSPDGDSIIESRLDLPGQGGVGLANNGNSTYLLHSTQTSLTSYTIRRGQALTAERPLRPSSAGDVKQSRATSAAHPAPQRHLEAPSSDVEQPLLRSSRSVASLREAQPASPSEHKSFAKFLAAKKADWRGEKPEKEEPKDTNTVQIGEGREVERDGGGSWDRIMLRSNGEGLGVVKEAVDTFSCDGTKLRIRKTITLDPGDAIQDVVFSSGHKRICLSTSTGLRTYDLKDPDSTQVEYMLSNRNRQAAPSVMRLDDGSRLWTAGPQGVELHYPAGDASDPSVVLRRRDPETASDTTHIATSSGDKIWSSDIDGNLLKRTLTELIGGSRSTSEAQCPDIDRLASSVTCIRSCAFGSRRHLVAGDQDGSIRVWDDSNAQLLASWTLFADPVRSITMIDMAEAGVLQNHLICVSQEGTIGIISLAQMEHLYLIPASRGPLRRIFVSGTDILLAYANGKARLWNVETMEFRRSTGLDAADDMLTSGASWKEVPLDRHSDSTPRTLSSLASSVSAGSDLGRALLCDPRRIESELKPLPTPRGLAMLSGLLSLFLTFGLDETIDQICRDHLGVVVPQQSSFIGTLSNGTGAVLGYVSGRQAWQLSAHDTGVRQLVIVTLLRPFLDSKKHEPYAIQVIAHFAMGLPDGIIPAELDFFASFYLDPSSDVQQAARMLFNATLDRMSEESLEVLISEHQARLSPAAVSHKTQDGAHSLLMIGAIALHKYQSVNPMVLKSVAEYILAILKNPLSPHLALAIELCSKGYTIWQTFADPMDLLRQLFHLSTRKDASSVNAQARLAVLHVASSNPALFMSTLSMDILNAESAEGRNSIMKLCVYMARKKPEVLENGLPRIAEAVVKSLDPNIGKMREDVWQAATVILNELVLAFSTIDFHSGTQKLAVGTHEGAVIMYELKTASRLYVLEPHRSPVSSVTFSPDGRRLLTVSLEEGLVTVWKVGSSLSGFFNVGGPPRQGGLGGTGPFKRIPFARLEDGPLSSTSALSDVHVSWPGPRQAKVMVGETAMSFET